MKSSTKHLLSKQQIIDLVHTNFSEDIKHENIKELSGGAFNSAYSISLPAKGKKIVLKVSSAPGTTVLSYESNIMSRELWTYDYIKDNTNLPVAEVICRDLSRTLIPSDYFFMNFVEGIPMNKLQRRIPEENLIEIKIKLAEYFSQIHSIRGSYFGYMTENQSHMFGGWREAFIHMYNMILQDGIELGIKLPYDRLFKCIHEKTFLLDDIKEPRLVNFDLWSGNIFLKQNPYGKLEIAAIVDFERAFWGDPCADFPSAVLLLKELSREPEFWKSYAKNTGRSTNIRIEDELRMVFYRMYLFTIMAVERYRYPRINAVIQGAFSGHIIDKCLKKIESQ